MAEKTRRKRKGTLAAAGFHAALADDGHDTSSEEEEEEGEEGKEGEGLETRANAAPRARKQRLENAKRLQSKIQGVSKKMRKLLLAVADNAHALRNLFAVFDEDGSGGVSPEELRIALSQFGILLNRKETRALISVVDENGDGELQYPELLALVDAVNVDENKRLEMKRAEDAIAAEEEATRKRREQKRLEKSKKRAAAAAAGASASQFFKFSNNPGDILDDSDSESDDEEEEGASLHGRRARLGLSLEEAAEDYVDKLMQDGATDEELPTAPLFLVVKRCMDAFLRQEAANAERLLAYYRAHDDNKDGNLDWKEFLRLVETMNERSGMKMKMSPEESGECYMEASRITTDSVRVDDQKFLLAMMVKGIVAPEISPSSGKE